MCLSAGLVLFVLFDCVVCVGICCCFILCACVVCMFVVLFCVVLWASFFECCVRACMFLSIAWLCVVDVCVCALFCVVCVCACACYMRLLRWCRVFLSLCYVRCSVVAILFCAVLCLFCCRVSGGLVYVVLCCNFYSIAPCIPPDPFWG